MTPIREVSVTVILGHIYSTVTQVHLESRKNIFIENGIFQKVSQGSHLLFVLIHTKAMSRPKIVNRYIKRETSPAIGQVVTLCYDKLTSGSYYVYTEATARYLGDHCFSFQKEGKWSSSIDLSQFPMDRYFEKRMKFVGSA